MDWGILLFYLFGQPCLFGQYGNDVIGKAEHVLIPSNFTLQYFKSQQIKENAKKNNSYLTMCILQTVPVCL